MLRRRMFVVALGQAIPQLRTIKHPALRKSNRSAVVAAIKLLGELRTKEAAPVLAELVLFGPREDAQDGDCLRAMVPSPHNAAPGVLAPIRIGMPALPPVTEQLLAITDASGEQAYAVLALPMGDSGHTGAVPLQDIPCGSV